MWKLKKQYQWYHFPTHCSKSEFWRWQREKWILKSRTADSRRNKFPTRRPRSLEAELNQLVILFYWAIGCEKERGEYTQERFRTYHSRSCLYCNAILFLKINFMRIFSIAIQSARNPHPHHVYFRHKKILINPVQFSLTFSTFFIFVLVSIL